MSFQANISIYFFIPRHNYQHTLGLGSIARRVKHHTTGLSGNKTNLSMQKIVMSAENKIVTE